MRTKRVSLVTCVYQRRELTRAFWTWAAWLRDHWAGQGITLDLVAAASDPFERDVAASFGVRAFLHPNYPLGGKFNAALAESRAADPEWVLIMGSDDFFCERAADALAAAIHADRSVGFRDLYYADLPNDRVRYLKGYRVKSRHTEPVGPGTLHSRATCERFHWRLWDATQHAGMDNSRFQTLKVHGVMPELLYLRDLDAVMLDVKTETNLWPFDRTRKQPVLSLEEGRAIWARLPAHVLDVIPWPQAQAVA